MCNSSENFLLVVSLWRRSNEIMKSVLQTAFSLRAGFLTLISYGSFSLLSIGEEKISTTTLLSFAWP